MNKAVFLDRDGVINLDHGYTYKIEDFEFVDGVFESCKKMVDLGYKLVVVTNQSGIGRGYYTPEDFERLTQWMKGEFLKQGIEISGVYFCPHHPQNAQGDYLRQCECRKPAPGMLLRAATELNLDLSLSIMVGDKESDIEAGRRAGVKFCVRVSESATETDADWACKSLKDLDWYNVCG